MNILTRDQINMLFGENLDSTIFTWQNYCGTRAVSLIRIFDNDGDIFNERFECRGWCFSDSLIGGFSKPNGIAVMLWDTEQLEDVWSHISIDFMNSLFIGWKLRKKK